MLRAHWGDRRVRNGIQSRALSGLPSLAGEDGGGASGPADVVVTGQNKYTVTMGLGTTRRAGRTRPRWSGLSPLLSPNGRGRVGGLGADQQGPDTNPTGLLQSGGGQVLTDSGGNSLRRVQGDHVSTSRVRHPGPRGSAVPAFPDPRRRRSHGHRRTRRRLLRQRADRLPVRAGILADPVVPGRAPTIYATGLTNVTDLAWHDGDLYAVQIADAGLASGGPPIGSLVRVNPGAAFTTRRGWPVRAVRRSGQPGNDASSRTCAVCAGGR